MFDPAARRLAAPFAVLTLSMAAASAALAQPALSAGVGKATMDIPAAVLPFQEFSVVHDPLQARVLLLGQGSKRVALVVIDMTSIFDDEIARTKDIVGRVADVKPEDVLVGASHTFSAPHIFSGPTPPGAAANPEEQQKTAQVRAALEAAVEHAASDAVHAMQPATMAFGVGVADVNVNRNMLTADGWWLGANDKGPSDKSVAVVRIEDQSRRPMAVLMNYAVQSAIMDQSIVGNGGKAITADLGGAAARHVEQLYGDKTVSMFLIGAAGDQFPSYKAQRYVMDKNGAEKLVDIGAQAYPLIDLLGERLGAEAVRVSELARPDASPSTLRVVNGAVSLPAQDRPRSLDALHPHKTYEFKIQGQANAPYYIMQVGDLALVGVQVELSSVTGEYIKQHSPFKHTLVMTMVNGAAKYMPDVSAYDQITYEAMNSPYGRGSAETFSADILKTLTAMHAGKTPG